MILALKERSFKEIALFILKVILILFFLFLIFEWGVKFVH